MERFLQYHLLSSLLFCLFAPINGAEDFGRSEYDDTGLQRRFIRTRLHHLSCIVHLRYSIKYLLFLKHFHEAKF